MNILKHCKKLKNTRFSTYEDVSRERAWEKGIYLNYRTSPGQESHENFENLKFNPFSIEEVLLDDSNDQDKNFCNSIRSVDTQCYFPLKVPFLFEKLHINLENFQ